MRPVSSAVIASAPWLCPCRGDKRMRWQWVGMPGMESGPWTAPCPHCGPLRLPIWPGRHRNDEQDRRTA